MRSVQTPLLQPSASSSVAEPNHQLLTSVASSVAGGSRLAYQGGPLSPIVGGELLQTGLGIDNGTDLSRLLDAQTILKQLNVSNTEVVRDNLVDLYILWALVICRAFFMRSSTASYFSDADHENQAG